MDDDMSMPTPSCWALSCCFWQPTLEPDRGTASHA